MTREIKDLMTVARILDAELPPAPWVADIDDPGTEHEEFTGKYDHPGSPSATALYDATPDTARKFAQMRNIFHELVGGTDGRKARLKELWGERSRLSNRIDALSRELESLQLAEAIEDHPCSCVRKNEDIGIWNAQGLANDKRNCLMGAGVISRLISADADCPECHGTGKPALEVT